MYRKFFMKFQHDFFLTVYHKITYRKMSLCECNLKLPIGDVKGSQRQTIYGKTYYSFEGIPYGKPPLGKYRFKAALPAEPWCEVRDCTEANIKPLQKNRNNNTVDGTEDCLYLNVYTKKLQSCKPLPVMVFIYGGAFISGDCKRKTRGPDYFMQKDVVLVIPNYRLDSLGFLSLNDCELEVPGNAGLKDQILALKWVKQYICHFNGDANNVTVFGESAGAVSVNYLMTTEGARDLFQKAILMSGCILNHWAHSPQKDSAFRLAKCHGYTGENVDIDILNFLQDLCPEKLVNYKILTEEERMNFNWHGFGPVIKPYVGEDCVIPQPPMEMLKTAWGNKIPILIGGTSFEGLVVFPYLRADPDFLDMVNDQPINLLPSEVREMHTKDELCEMAMKIVNAHFGTTNVKKDMKMNFLHFCSYKMFWHGIHRYILARLNYSKSPTYLYRFSFDSPDFNHYRNKFSAGECKTGAAHAEELSYMFLLPQSWKLKTDSSEYITIQRMIGIWTGFAEKSNPNCVEIQNVKWEPLQKSNPFKAADISCDVEIMEQPEKHKLEIWNTLYTKTNLY